MSYLYLAIGIVAEVTATIALKFCDGSSTNPMPYIIVVLGYGTALCLLALTLRDLPTAIAYGIWAGAGMALVLVVAIVVHGQIPDPPALIGIALITIGVIVIQSSTMRV